MRPNLFLVTVLSRNTQLVPVTSIPLHTPNYPSSESVYMHVYDRARPSFTLVTDWFIEM